MQIRVGCVPNQVFDPGKIKPSFDPGFVSMNKQRNLTAAVAGLQLLMFEGKCRTQEKKLMAGLGASFHPDIAPKHCKTSAPKLGSVDHDDEEGFPQALMQFSGATTHHPNEWQRLVTY